MPRKKRWRRNEENLDGGLSPGDGMTRLSEYGAAPPNFRQGFPLYFSAYRALGLMPPEISPERRCNAMKFHTQNIEHLKLIPALAHGPILSLLDV